MLTQPRYAYIQRQVLSFYKSLPRNLLAFPLDVKAALKSIKNCKISSYQYFADGFNVPVEDVIGMCGSGSGCTYYDSELDRFLVLYNNSTENNNVIGRQAWTLAHELGHIKLNHHMMELEGLIAENSFSPNKNAVSEIEADYFASQLLAPFPLFPMHNIMSSLDVQRVFGLSSQASVNRFSEYIKWKSCRVKTAYENDLIRIFQSR